MSIQKLNSNEAQKPQVDPSLPDSFETALITQLVREVYSEVQPGTGKRNPRGAVKNRPPQDNGLAGVYPGTVRPYAPPVHPASPRVSGDRKPLSGGHSSGDSDSFPFGEPRPEAEVKRLSRNAPSSENKAAEPNPFPFYFLSGPPAQPDISGSAVPPVLLPGPPGFDVKGIRRDFPALHQQVNGKPLIWFDNAATTHKPQSVIDAISHFYGRDNSNIHRAAHALAARATDLYEGARRKAQQFIGAADPREIVFVRGTTEAINLVAQSYGRKNIGSGDEILITAMEHHANIVPWQLLAEQTGAVIRVAPINDAGELMLDPLAALLSSRTRIVAVTHVSNSLGTINPIEQIIALAHGYGIPVLVDGAQSTPHFPVSVQAMDADFFTFSGHKIFGPTGIGVLYGKSHLLEAMPPWQGGGNMIREVTFTKTTFSEIPQKFEAGTPNIAGAVGLGAAIDYLTRTGLQALGAYEHELLSYATEGLQTVQGLRLIGTAARKTGVLSFVIEGLDVEEMGKYLDKQGIAVRAGHHCAQPSLRRFGLNGTVRPSLAFYNTRQEVDSLVNALHDFPKKRSVWAVRNDHA